MVSRASLSGSRIQPLPVNWTKFRQIFELLHGVRSNAVFLLREGRSDKEVANYLMRYLMITDEEAAKH